MDTLDPRALDRLLRRREVERITGLARATIYAEISKGRFPAPLKITDKAVAWRESDVREWLASRVRVGRQSRSALIGTASRTRAN